MPMIEAKEAEQEWKQWLREFHKFWVEHDKPHPSSNEYLLLNRVFFYTRGLAQGSGMAKWDFEPPVQPSEPSSKVKIN